MIKAATAATILASAVSSAHANPACQALLVPMELESYTRADQAIAFMDTWDETKFSKAKSGGSFGAKFPLAKGLLDSSANYGSFKSKLSEIKRKSSWEMTETQAAWYVHKELPAHATQAYIACLTATPLSLRIVSSTQSKTKFMVELAYNASYNGSVALSWVHDNVENAKELPSSISPKSAISAMVKVQDSKEPVLLAVNGVDGGTARVEFIPNVSDDTVRALEKLLAEYSKIVTPPPPLPPPLSVALKLEGGTKCTANVTGVHGSIAGGSYEVWHSHGRAFSRGPHVNGGSYNSRVFEYEARPHHVNVFGAYMSIAQDGSIWLNGAQVGTLTCP